MTTPSGSTLTRSSREVFDKTIKSIDELITEVRGNASSVDAHKAQALLETTAEVLLGLKKAYQDYEGGSEKAWQ